MIAVRPTLRAEAGFTILELMVAAFVSLMLGIAGFAFFRGQLRSLTDQSAGLDAIEGARAALDFMANDIRMAGATPTGSCASCGAGLSNAGANALTIAWDANANGTLDAGESITYAYDANTSSISRTVNGSTQTLIKNVPAGGFSLQYFDSGGAASAMTGGHVTTPSGVVAIQVNVRVQAARATAVFPVTLTTRVALRNRSTVLSRLSPR